MKNIIASLSLVLLPTFIFAAPLRNYYSLSPHVFRSAAPGAAASSLIQDGFTDVLIFKNETGAEVRSEIQLLKASGLRGIHHIPMTWNDQEGFASTCPRVMAALKVLVQVDASQDRRVLFHCTVGEDRTGMLAGLFRMLTQKWSVKKAFSEEMCAHGYEAGSSRKPPNVVDAIRQGLTPAFLRIAYLIEKGELTKNNVSEKFCNSPSLKDSALVSSLQSKGRFICQ